MTNDVEWAWAAGVISVSGVFKATPIFRTEAAGGRTKSARLEVQSAKHPEVMDRLASILDTVPREYKRGGRMVRVVVLFGDDLHAAMGHLWDNLSNERKHAYAAVRRTQENSIQG